MRGKGPRRRLCTVRKEFAVNDTARLPEIRLRFARRSLSNVVAEKSGRTGEPVGAFLRQAGCDAEVMNLKDKGILGNGHFAMLENNRRQVFDAIRGWIEQKLPGGASSATGV